MTEKREKIRDRFDVRPEWRKEQEKRLRATLGPMLARVAGNAAADEAMQTVIPYLQDEAARIAQDWMRRHQLGDRYLGWVDPEQSPED